MTPTPGARRPIGYGAPNLGLSPSMEKEVRDDE
jgi:hypothetical protein